MNVTTTAVRRAAVQVGVRLFALVYMAAFAVGGYLAWGRITGLSLFGQPTRVTGPWYAQMAAGFLDAMVLAGPMIGMVVGAGLIMLYQRRKIA